MEASILDRVSPVLEVRYARIGSSLLTDWFFGIDTGCKRVNPALCADKHPAPCTDERFIVAIGSGKTGSAQHFSA
jgi:hypothetical protein